MMGWTSLAIGIILLLFCAKMVFVASAVLSLHKTGGAFFVPTPKDRLGTALEFIPMKKGEVLVDLGCGDGRVLREVYKKYGLTCVGYEVNPLAYVLARGLCARYRKIRVLRKDFMAAYLGGADVICCYLFPDVMEPLALKLKRELRKGARVVCFNFPLPGWEPKMIMRPSLKSGADPIYYYEVS